MNHIQWQEVTPEGWLVGWSLMPEKTTFSRLFQTGINTKGTNSLNFLSLCGELLGFAVRSLLEQPLRYARLVCVAFPYWLKG